MTRKSTPPSAVFDDGARHDVGQTYLQLFDVALANWLGMGSSLCTFASRCGSAFALEHNGDLYSCDHYVYPQYCLGNLLSQDLLSIAESDAQRRFASLKSDSLPRHCRQCRYRFARSGECPKHRFATSPDGEADLNYLCPSYKRFLAHVEPYMQTMAWLINGGRSGDDHGPRRAAQVVSRVRLAEPQRAARLRERA